MTRRRKQWLIGGAITLVTLALIFVFTTWPRDILGAPLTLHETPRPSDVIIILGAGTKKNDNNFLPTQAEQRVAEGALLFRLGYAPKVIVAGGYSPTTKLVEADLMAPLGVIDGISSSAITKERKSRNTWQNAANSLVIMESAGEKTALVVTSPYHTSRACHFFRQQGADVRCISAPYSIVPADSFGEKFSDNRSVVREYAAWVYAWLQGHV